MSNESVVITDCELPGTAIIDTLREAGHSVTASASNSVDDILAAAVDATALVVQWATVSEELLDQLPRLQFISRLGIGYDMIDVEAATKRGIAVANTPTYCVEEVAAHTLAMILGQARGLKFYDSEMRAGVWSAVNAHPMSVRPSTTTVSVIGLGRIGSRVASWCLAIGFKVLVVDPYQDPEAIRARGYTPVTMDEAIVAADILTIHAPLTNDTQHLINASVLSKMKPTSSIVNTCRGQLIDEVALASAIAESQIGGAALDVFESEPLNSMSRLREFDTVQLTPHSAWYSKEALEDLPVHAAKNVIDFFGGEVVSAIVNPEYVKLVR